MFDASLRRQLGFMVVLAAAFALAAYVLAGSTCALWVTGSGFSACTAFTAISIRRRCEIRRLTSEIDSVLHSGRAIDFSSCKEGDVAILRNEVGKVVARMSLASQQAYEEKEALGCALTDISHQIRTPLTSIGIMIPLIERAPAETRRAKLRELENMVERVSWLVTTLLKMARVDAGALNMQRETVSVSAMMRQALAPLELALDVRGIRCAVEISEDARYQGDMLWSAEAFENIVKNCMEHTPAGGTITIRAHADAVACRICVSDTGPGIAEADLPHIFDRFYRGSAHGIAPRSNAHAEGAAASDNFAMPAMHGVAGTPKTQSSIQGQAQDSTQNPAQDIPEPQGFGVGLALAHSIISAQGGTIRASNAPQAGACFSVTFPLITTL